MAQKIVQILYNDQAAYRECMLLNKPLIEDHGADHVILTDRVLTKGARCFCEDTDIERLFYLQNNPTAWYLDADTVIKKWPDFEMEPGYPYISCGDTGYYDTWAIFGNGCYWFFDYLMNIYMDFNCNPPRWWSHDLMNGLLKDKIRPVPEDYFFHLHFSGVSKSAPLSWHNDDFE